LTAFAEAETFVRGLAHELTCVRPGECVYCYAIRMIDAFGCDTTLRWAARFRDLTAPRATALESRLGQMGGYCDCEIFLNGVSIARADGTAYDDEDASSWEIRPCSGVRSGSTQGCAQWARRARWPRW
jgi:hypothetical protein